MNWHRHLARKEQIIFYGLVQPGWTVILNEMAAPPSGKEQINLHGLVQPSWTVMLNKMTSPPSQ